MDAVSEVKKAQRGNQKAFEDLILSYTTVMYRMAKTMLDREEDCADAIQDAILKAYQNIRSLKEPRYFKTWLLRIIINECKRIYRQRKNIIALEPRTELGSNDYAFARIEIEEFLECLPEEQRELLKLFHIEDISIQDLADIFDVPESTIKTRLRRAREKAKEIWLAEEGRQWNSGTRQLNNR
jgi:RNA polymerase sigma-70 factor (ECF subfamily)